MSSVFVYDPSATDELSRVRGIGRYMQILQENFPDWNFVNTETMKQWSNEAVFIHPFINFLQRPVLTKRIATKQIAVIHDLIPLKYPDHFPAGITGKLNIFANKLALKNYDLIITDSMTSKTDIVSMLNIDEEKVRIIYPTLPNIFSNSKINPAHATSNKLHVTQPYCLYVGDVTWNKNLVNLAKAIKVADVTCIFVGKQFKILKLVQDDNNKTGDRGGRPPDSAQTLTSTGGRETEGRTRFVNPWLKEFNEFATLASGDKHFIFPGFVSDEELIELYQHATCNLLVSRDEGFGFSYLEAASQGCPSILSDIPVFHETAKDSALFVDPENPENMAKKIQELFQDEKKRLELKKAATLRGQYFSSKKFTNMFTDIWT